MNDCSKGNLRKEIIVTNDNFKHWKTFESLRLDGGISYPLSSLDSDEYTFIPNNFTCNHKREILVVKEFKLNTYDYDGTKVYTTKEFFDYIKTSLVGGYIAYIYQFTEYQSYKITYPYREPENIYTCFPTCIDLSKFGKTIRYGNTHSDKYIQKFNYYFDLEKYSSITNYTPDYKNNFYKFDLPTIQSYFVFNEEDLIPFILRDYFNTTTYNRYSKFTEFIPIHYKHKPNFQLYEYSNPQSQGINNIPDIIEMLVPKKLQVLVYINETELFYPLALPALTMKVRIPKRLKLDVHDIIKQMYDKIFEMQYNEILDDPT